MFSIFVKAILLLSLTFSLVACQNNTPSSKTEINSEKSILSPNNEALYKKVVAIHDDVMPENSTIVALQQKLKKYLPKVSEDKKPELLEILSDLQKGFDAMMDWMHEFKNLELDADIYAKWTDSEIENYLKKEEDKIKHVAELMRSSIAHANAWIKQSDFIIID